jgi:biuret amidohydrolase
MLKCLLPYSEIFNTLFPERLLPVQMSRTLRINAEPYEFEFQPARCALLIIDMQRDFLEPGGFAEMLGNDVSQLRHTIDPNRKVLAAWRSAGLQVIHTREGHRPDLADLPPAKKIRGHGKTSIGIKGRWVAF